MGIYSRDCTHPLTSHTFFYHTSSSLPHTITHPPPSHTLSPIICPPPPSSTLPQIIMGVLKQVMDKIREDMQSLEETEETEQIQQHFENALKHIRHMRETNDGSYPGIDA